MDRSPTATYSEVSVGLWFGLGHRFDRRPKSQGHEKEWDRFRVNEGHCTLFITKLDTNSAHPAGQVVVAARGSYPVVSSQLI